MTIQKKEAKELLQRYHEYRYNDEDERATPPVFLSIPSQDCIIAHDGDLIVISGASKVGKSSVCAALIAGVLDKQDATTEVLGLDVTSNVENGAVLYFNTELGETHFRKFNRSILSRAGLKMAPETFFSYNFCGISHDELEAHTRNIIEAARSCYGLKLIVIDGIADYVQSVNEEVECNRIVDFLMQTAKKFQVPVVVVIHTNPGDRKLRGHLGSQLERKCEALLEIVKNGRSGGSIITAKQLRGAAPFEPIGFEFNEEVGYHELLGTHVELVEKRKAEKKLNRKREVRNVTQKLLSNGKLLAPNELVRGLCEELKVCERTAKSYLKEMRNAIITKNKSGEYSLMQN